MDLGPSGQIGQHARKHVRTVSHKKVTLRVKHDQELVLTLLQLKVVMTAEAVKMMSIFATRKFPAVSFHSLHDFYWGTQLRLQG